MKKVLLIVVVLLCSINVFAQNTEKPGRSIVDLMYFPAKSTFFMSLAAGLFQGEYTNNYKYYGSEHKYEDVKNTQYTTGVQVGYAFTNNFTFAISELYLIDAESKHKYGEASTIGSLPALS